MVRCIIRNKNNNTSLLLVTIDEEAAYDISKESFNFEVINGLWNGTYHKGMIILDDEPLSLDNEILFWDAEFIYKDDYNQVIWKALEKIENNDFSFKEREYVVLKIPKEETKSSFFDLDDIAF